MREREGKRGKRKILVMVTIGSGKLVFLSVALCVRTNLAFHFKFSALFDVSVRILLIAVEDVSQRNLHRL